MSGLACQATGLKLGYVWNEPVPMTCFPTIPSLRVKGLPLLRRARRHNCSAMGITAYTFRQSLIIVLAFANKELEREILTLLTFSAPHTWPVTVWTRHDWQFQIVTEIVGSRFPIQVTGVGRGDDVQQALWLIYIDAIRYIKYIQIQAIITMSLFITWCLVLWIPKQELWSKRFNSKRFSLFSHLLVFQNWCFLKSPQSKSINWSVPVDITSEFLILMLNSVFEMELFNKTWELEIFEAA